MKLRSKPGISGPKEKERMQDMKLVMRFTLRFCMPDSGDSTALASETEEMIPCLVPGGVQIERDEARRQLRVLFIASPTSPSEVRGVFSGIGYLAFRFQMIKSMPISFSIYLSEPIGVMPSSVPSYSGDCVRVEEINQEIVMKMMLDELQATRIKELEKRIAELERFAAPLKALSREVRRREKVEEEQGERKF